MKNYHETVKMLDQLFDQLNKKYYNSEIGKPVITVMHDHTKSAYGWCTTQKIWKAGEEEFYEINICAEYLNRPIAEVAATLLHEMAHLYNLEHDIKDCSGGGYYHNKKFKETAEAHGLVIEKVARYGWTKTSLQEETAEWIEKKVKIEAFDLVRSGGKKPPAGTKTGDQTGAEGEDGEAVPKKSKYKYYVCPVCGKKFYSIYEINAECTDCGVAFEQYR